MATIVTKYSDYVIHSIEYFITQIEAELAYRDVPGLTNEKVQKINVQKEHPLVSLMSSSLNESSSTNELFRSGLLPAISVTPGSMTDEGFTLGQSYRPETVDDDFIDELRAFSEKTVKEIQDDVLISYDQIDSIIAAYNQSDAGQVRVQINQWHKSEEINISVWSMSPDLDIVLGNLMDSILATIQVGFVGDDSKLRKFAYKITKGLTNFNYGRVLFGSEYNLTFLNTFNNYIVYTDDVLSGHDFDGTFTTIGEE